jgi:N-acetylglucosamine-6-sulfatase
MFIQLLAHTTSSLRIFIVLCILTACTPPQSQKPTSVSQISSSTTDLNPIYPTTSSSSSTRPNILFILTDDQDYASIEYMPWLKKALTEEGVQLTNYFINVSACCPSRATTLLGQYSHNSHILTNDVNYSGGFETFYKLGLEDKTIAVALQSAGYRTVLLGKYLNGYPNGVPLTHIPPGWTEWYSPSRGNPYMEYNYTLNENGELVTYKRENKNYMTDVLSSKAVDFIQRNAKIGQPFFMFLSTYAPHSPSTPAYRHFGLFKDLIAPRTSAFNEEDVTDKPKYIRERNPLTPEEQTLIDDLYVNRLRSLQAVDEMIIKLVITLKRVGQLENTYIFFTSDNGYRLGEHRMDVGKGSPYEEDIRVPLIVRGPGIPQGLSRDEIVGNVDLAQTFAEIASVDYPGCDGRSLMPTLIEGTSIGSWRGAYLLEHWFGERGMVDHPSEEGTLEPPEPTLSADTRIDKLGIPAFKGLRTESYLYVEYDTD